MLKYTITILILIIFSKATYLPDYFQKCSLSDTKLNNCLTKSATDALSSMVHGDKSAHIQQLDPLNVQFIYFPAYHNFAANWTNTNLSGFTEMIINNIKIDLEKNMLDLNFLIPQLNFFGVCMVHGDLLSVHLEGHGITNLTFVDMENHLHIAYKLIENKEKHFIEILNHSMVYNISKINLKMDVLGETINLFLNENWEAINNEFKDPIGNLIGSIFVEVLKPFFNQIAYEELFTN